MKDYSQGKIDGWYEAMNRAKSIIEDMAKNNSIVAKYGVYIKSETLLEKLFEEEEDFDYEGM